MLLAVKTLGATRGGAVAGAGVGVGTGVGVGVGSGVGVALGVGDTVAVGLAEGAELATLGVPQAASTMGAMRASSSFLVILLFTSKSPAWFCMLTGILLASEIFQAMEIYTWPGYSDGT
jgi:hypothetical protein